MAAILAVSLTVVAMGHVVVSASVKGHGQGFEPMVAMYCGESTVMYYNKYLSESGIWLTDTDPQATCAHSKVEVLEYCKKVYPDRDITNIVESNKELKLGTWCKPGSNECVDGDTSVRPYRCLEGPFQSDPLLVPEQCQFDHIHNQSLCQSYTAWNNTARGTCNSREMILRSFAILLPCGVDLFSGVEFVCCPTSVKQLIQTGYGQDLLDNEQDEDYYADEEDTYYNDGFFSKESEQSVQEEETSSKPVLSEAAKPVISDASTDEVDDASPKEAVVSDTTEDPYLTHYMPQSEHSDFVQATQRLDEKHKERVASLMKDWNNLKLTSGDGKDQDSQFQDTQAKQYQESLRELEDEHKAERRQLAALHEQRVMSRFQSKKKNSISCLTKALKKTPQNLHRIRLCAEKVMKALHKERNHAIKQFRRLAQTSPEIASGEMEVTLSQLKDIDTSVNDYFDMLQQDPVLQEKVSKLLKDFVTVLRNKDDTPSYSFLNDPDTERNILEKILEEEKEKKAKKTTDGNANTEMIVEHVDDSQDDLNVEQVLEMGDKEMNEDSELIASLPSEGDQTNTLEKDEPKNTINAVAVEVDNDTAEGHGAGEGLENESVDSMTIPTDDNISGEKESFGKIKVEVHATAQDNHIPGEVIKSSEQHLPKIESDAIVTHLEPFPFNIGFVDTPKPIMMGETAVASHAQAHQLTHSPLSYTMRHTTDSSHNSVYVLSLLGTGLMVVIIIGIVLRKRSSLPYTHDGFIQVDTSGSVEEQAVSSMQMTGYENPTYKYFETST